MLRGIGTVKGSPMPESDRELTHRTISGLLWTGCGKVGHAGLTLLTLVVLARLLSPQEFGTVGAALVVVEFSSIFSRLGLGPAVVQRRDLEQRHLQAAFTGSLLLGLLMGAGIWWGAPLAAAFFQNAQVEPVLKALAWTFPLMSLSAVAESLMFRELRFRWIANVDLATYALGYGLVAVFLALAGLGVWALVAAVMVQTTARSTILLYVRRPPLAWWLEWGALKDMLHFGTGFTLAKVANQLALQGDNLVVGHWLGPAALGLYGRAYHLMSVPASVIGKVLDDVLFPTMARVQDEVERLGRAYRRGVAVIALVALPASIVSFVLAPELIQVALGPRWSEAVMPFRVLVIGTLFRTSYKLSDSLARSTGVVYRRARRQIVYAGLVIGGAYVGQHWGITGVSVGVLVALAANFLLMAQLSLEVCRLSWSTFWAAHTPSFLLAGVCGIITWSVAASLREWSVGSLGILLVTCGVAAISGIGLMWRFPGRFLGPDGRWTAEALLAFAPRRGGRSAARIISARTGESA
jgi:O-antigen/teichoic acid export membrane protein